jgi:hypothetical protein
VTDRLRRDDKTALVTFGDRVSLRRALGSPRAGVPIDQAVSAGQGRTALVDAAYATLWVTRGDPGRTLAIVFSDGLDTASM